MRATATSVLKLVQGAKVFLIPTFQRRYTWKKDQWQQLWHDLIAEAQVRHVDDQDALDGHFLGSVVLHPAPGPASTLMRHQVIDGQQRLTTILVLLAAFRDIRKQESNWNPQSIDEQYLKNSFNDDYPDRLVPTKLDRESFIQTVRYSNPIGEIGMAYNYFFQQLSQYKHEGGSLAELQDTLLLRMLIVEINTKVGDSVNSIFNTLNSKGMPLSPADLVRNELLHHVGEHDAEHFHEKYWIPMEMALVKPKAKNPDREFVTFLWSREVALDTRVSRDNLFSMFEKRLRSELSTATGGSQARENVATSELKSLYRDHTLFLALRDSRQFDTFNTQLDAGLRHELSRLSNWKAEPATPIALWVLRSALDGNIKQDDATNIIHILLSFLIRRVISGIPTNQLNRLLTPIAHELSETVAKGDNPVAKIREILSRQGYYWPTHSQVIAGSETTPIYASARRYAKYLLETAEDRTEGLERADLGRVQIEHIIPQSIPDHWQDYLRQHNSNEIEADSVIHTLGNLTLTESNQKMGNISFGEKTDFYYNSSIRMNREISRYSPFTPEVVKQRAKALAERILSVYDEGPIEKNSPDSFTADGSSLTERLRSLLQSLKVDTFVLDETLVAILGAPIQAIRDVVRALDPTLARLVRDVNGEIPNWLPEKLKTDVEVQLASQGNQGNWSEATDDELLALSSENEDDDASDTDTIEDHTEHT